MPSTRDGPAELPRASSFFGTLKVVDKGHLYTIVEAYCACAFGFLHGSMQPYAAAVLDNEIQSFSTGVDLRAKAMFTNNSREICNTDDSLHTKSIR